MHQYALHYYQHATALRYVRSCSVLPYHFFRSIIDPACSLFASDRCIHSPYDVRIWQAQGICYEEMGR